MGCSSSSHVSYRRAWPTWQALRDKIGCQVVAVCSETTGDFAKRWAHSSGLRFFNDATELIKSNDIDTVYIAKRGVDHVPLATQALSHGKNVLVEKPLIFLEGDEPVKMLKLAREHRLKCAVNHTYFGSPLADIRFHHRLNLSALGDVQFVTVKMRSGGRWFDVSDDWHWRFDLGGGVARDLAPHALTICYCLLKRMDPASWRVGFGDGINELNAVGLSGGNTNLILDLSWGGSPSQEVQVHCKDGSLVIKMLPKRWEIHRNGELDFEHPVDINKWWEEVFTFFASGNLDLQQSLSIELEANKIYRALKVRAQTA